MKVLHICNDYCGSKVHANLYKRLDDKLDHQIVYTYFDGKDNIGKNTFSSEKTKIVYDDVLNPYMRKIYPLKIWWVYRHLVNKVDMKEISCVHATTLFSDGGIAFSLYKKYGIPYIVAVRTTDLAIYIKKVKALWGYGRKILLNASKIIVINKAYENDLKSMDFSKDIWDLIKDKVLVQPNGIDDYWINNVYRESKCNNFKICYVGTFIKRKNIPRLIQAVDSLRADYPNLALELIGGGGTIGNEEDFVKKMAEERPYVTLVGRLTDKDRIREKFSENSIYAMPSWNETFGLVYIEALTQNLRLLYTKNDGVDGLFDNVGVAVDPFSVDSIREGLREILRKYDQFAGNKDVDFSNFDWSVIANRYYSVFEQITK